MRSFPLIAASAALLLSAVPALADPFSFVVLGPAPHAAPEDARVALRVNEAAPDLVLHMGVARPAAGCDAEALRRRTMYLGAFDAPTMVVAGKGDRLACAMVRGRPDQPLEAHYEAVHPVPWLSQGRRKAVLRNAWAEGRPDDASLMRDGVAFITVGTGDPSVAAGWVRAAMAEAGAQGATAMAVALPAPLDAPELIPVARALTEAATAFGKPVLALQPAEDGAAEISLAPGEAPNLTVLSAPNAQNGPLTQVFVRARPSPSRSRPPRRRRPPRPPRRRAAGADGAGGAATPLCGPARRTPAAGPRAPPLCARTGGGARGGLPVPSPPASRALPVLPQRGLIASGRPSLRPVAIRRSTFPPTSARGLAPGPSAAARGRPRKPFRSKGFSAMDRP